MGQQFVQDDADRLPIGARRRWRAGQLLGRRAVGRARRAGALGLRLAGPLGNAEIEHCANRAAIAAAVSRPGSGSSSATSRSTPCVCCARHTLAMPPRPTWSISR